MQWVAGFGSRFMSAFTSLRKALDECERPWLCPFKFVFSFVTRILLPGASKGVISFLQFTRRRRVQFAHLQFRLACGPSIVRPVDFRPFRPRRVFIQIFTSSFVSFSRRWHFRLSLLPARVFNM